MALDTLRLVTDLNAVLAKDRDVWSNVRACLELLRHELLLASAFILFYNTDSQKLDLAAASGLDAAAFRRLENRSNDPFFEQAFADAAPDPAVADLPEVLSFLSPERPLKLGIAPLVVGADRRGLIAGVYSPVEPSETRTQGLALASSLIGQTLRIERAIAGERQRLAEENFSLKKELREKHDFSHIIGTSNAMKQVFDQVTQVARSNATVLLRGESGTGKEMIANAIHYNSLRSKRSLVKVNCAALPDTLIEAELFGHEKGAFTGADKAKKGRFEMAEGGTLFLDEIGDLPLQTQIKLLRVLQEREFERLGGTETIRTNIRLITATNKNLEEAIADGRFREDLYYRLNVFTIYLPPLRNRRPDILLLAEHFLEKYEKEHGKRIRRISTPAIDMLMSYHFPGNVRELENAVERAVLVCDSNVIHGHHLPPTLQTAEVSGTETKLTLVSAVSAFERDLIQDTLKSTGGNIAEAARQLDSTERILGYKIKKYGIDTMRFKR